MARGGRLLLEHVEGRAGHLAALDGRRERRLVDDPAARAVDDAHAAPHARERARADEPARLRRERGVDGDEVGARVELVERDQLDAQARGDLVGDEGVVGDHLHAQPEGPLGDDGADVAEADDAEHLVAHLGAEPLLPLPAPRAHAGRGLRDVARQGEQQRDRVLGGGDVGSAGRVHDHDALLGGGIDVDVVDADARPADHAQRVRPREHVGGDLGAAADDEGVEAAHRVPQLRRRETGARLDLELRLLAEPRQPLGAERVGQQDPVGHQPRAGSPSARMRSAAPTPRPSSTGAPK